MALKFGPALPFALAGMSACTCERSGSRTTPPRPAIAFPPVTEPPNTRVSAVDIGSQNAACEAAAACTPAPAGATATTPIAETSAMAPASFPFFISLSPCGPWRAGPAPPRRIAAIYSDCGNAKRRSGS